MNNSKYSHYSSSSLPRKNTLVILYRKGKVQDALVTYQGRTLSIRRGRSPSIQRNSSLSIRDSRGHSSSIRNLKDHDNDHSSTIINSRRFGNSYSPSIQRNCSPSIRDSRGCSSSIRNPRGHNNDHSLTIMDSRRFSNSHSLSIQR
ncbi:4375_t:CDS:2, partial [Funneliformis caledonium]